MSYIANLFTISPHGEAVNYRPYAPHFAGERDRERERGRERERESNRVEFKRNLTVKTSITDGDR